MKCSEIKPGVELAMLSEREGGIAAHLTAEVRQQMKVGCEVEFFTAVREAVMAVETSLRDVVALLADMKTHEGPKVVVLRPPTPYRRVPPTPAAYPTHGTQTPLGVDVLRAALIELVGWYPYGFTTQQQGAIHNDVIAVPEAEAVRNHSGSQQYEVSLHTEDASFNLGEHHDLSPDFLTLQYVRNPFDVPTVISMPDWHQLSTETVALLREAWFTNRTAPLQGGSENDPTVPVGIVYGPQDEPWFRINTGRLESERYIGRRRDAVLEFRNHLEARRTELPSLPGDIVIIDNRRVAHARPGRAHKPAYDGSDRWQRRVVVSNDRERVRVFEAGPHVADPRRLLASARARQA